MEDPLAVSVRSADPALAVGFARRLREELQRRGAPLSEVTVEVATSLIAAGGVEVRPEDGVERAAATVIARLGERSRRSGAQGSAYTPEEEAEVQKRLEDLGYM